MRSRNRNLWAVALCLAPALAGCATGRAGELADAEEDLSDDLFATILEAEAEKGDDEEVWRAVGIPFYFLPVIGVAEWDRVDRSAAGEVEGVRVKQAGWLTPAIVSVTDMTFRADGRLLGYVEDTWLAFGVLGGRDTVRVRDDGSLEIRHQGRFLWMIGGD